MSCPSLPEKVKAALNDAPLSIAISPNNTTRLTIASVGMGKDAENQKSLEVKDTTKEMDGDVSANNSGLLLMEKKEGNVESAEVNNLTKGMDGHVSCNNTWLLLMEKDVRKEVCDDDTMKKNLSGNRDDLVHSPENDEVSNSKGDEKGVIESTQRKVSQNSYQEELIKLKKEFSTAQTMAKHQTATSDYLRKELARVQRKNEILNVENDALVNDRLDIVAENEELKILLKRTLDKKCAIKNKLIAVVQERNMLEKKLEIKETELVKCEEVIDLVELMRQRVKGKLTQADFRQQELEIAVQNLMLEKTEMVEAIEALMRDSNNVQEEMYTNNQGEDTMNCCDVDSEDEDNKLIMALVRNMELR
mmetsp:Transcript_20636/g.30321  ORF Transcript_20636/g.30321 Transcript_20636/m.30321 type:complete len:362 (-) Transcript_20636:542-1627(-)